MKVIHPKGGLDKGATYEVRVQALGDDGDAVCDLTHQHNHL